METDKPAKQGAVQKVRANHGALGIDGVAVDELESQVRKYYRPLVRKLRAGTYKPQPVKRVYFPKPDGMQRKLGIPRVQGGDPPGTYACA